MRKLLLFALSLSLTTPIISEAASTTSSDHRGLGAVTTTKNVKYRRKLFANTPKDEHHQEVIMHEGKVISIKLVNSKTGAVLFHGMPYGLDAVNKAGKNVTIKKHTLASYKKFMETHLKSLNLANTVAPQIANSPLKASTTAHKSARMATMATVATSATPTYPADCSTTGNTTLNYTCGISAAADTTTGWISGSACYNFNSSLIGGAYVSSDFSSSNSFSSLAQQLNASGSISGTYGLFSGTADFSLSDEWNSSANSVTSNFSFLNVFQLSNTLDPIYPLSQNGRNAVTTNSFAGLCGDRFVVNQYAGMLITGKLQVNAQTTSVASSISTSMSASYGLNSLSAAVSSAKTNTEGGAQISFSIRMLGGGPAAVAIISNAVGSSNYTGTASYNDLAACTTGFDTSACNAFTTNLSAQANKANTQFTTDLYVTGNAAKGFSILHTFPDGVSGTATPLPAPATSAAMGYLTVMDPSTIISDATNALNNTTSFSLTTNSALLSYTTEITTYLTILNQINTLKLKAQRLSTALAVNSGYDPNQEMDSLIALTNNLAAVYGGDRAVMVANLETCFKTGTATTALTDCAPILNLYARYNPDLTSDILTVWDWYTQSYKALVSGLRSTAVQVFAKSTNATFIQSALQNSLALQYASTFQAHNGDPSASVYATNNFNYPNDVLWVTNLPAIWRCESANPYTCSNFANANIYSTTTNTIPNPAAKPALITFNDYNWPGLMYYGTMLKSWVNLIPLDSSTADMFSLTTYASPYRYTIYDLGFSQSYELPPTEADLTASPLGCVQNFGSPCGYYQAAKAPKDNQEIKISNDLEIIPNFFVHI